MGAPVATLGKGFGLLALQEGREGMQTPPRGWRFEHILHELRMCFYICFQAFLDDLLASCLARGPAGRGWGEGKLILNVDLTYSKSNLNLI